MEDRNLDDLLGKLVEGYNRLLGRMDDLEQQESPGADMLAWANLVSMALAMPGIVEFWPFSSSAGGLGRGTSGAGLHLINNGPTLFTRSGLAPIARFLSGAYFSRADEAALRVTGAEAHIVTSLRGLTFLAWALHNDAASATENYLAKYTTAGNQRGYFFQRRSIGVLRFSVSPDGINDAFVDTTDVVGATTYNFIAARFTPSTSLDIFINDSLYSETTGVPASIFASTAQFCIGGDSAGSNTLLGNMSGAILCAMALPDAMIQAYYHATRSLFGL